MGTFLPSLVPCPKPLEDSQNHRLEKKLRENPAQLILQCVGPCHIQPVLGELILWKGGVFTFQ